MSTFRSCALCLAVIFAILSGPVLAADGPPGDLFGRLNAKIKEGEPFQLLVQIKLKPGSEAKFAAEAAKTVKATADEPGCEMYALFEDREQPGTVYLFEKWKSIAALKSHIEQPYVQSLLKLFGELGIEPKITLLGPLPATK